MSIEDSMMNAKTRMQKIGLVLAKHQRKGLIAGGLFLIGLSFYLGVSFLSWGSTTYIMGVWWLCSGLFLGLRDRYNIVLMGVGMGLWFFIPYDLPYRLMIICSGVGILCGAFNALIYSINNAGKAKKMRLAPPKPPWMAITLVSILALGMISPLNCVRITTAASAKYEITITENGEILYQRGDDFSSYDVLLPLRAIHDSVRERYDSEILLGEIMMSRVPCIRIVCTCTQQLSLRAFSVAPAN